MSCGAHFTSRLQWSSRPSAAVLLSAERHAATESRLLLAAGDDPEFLAENDGGLRDAEGSSPD
jgi:hypothetical protein